MHWEQNVKEKPFHTSIFMAVLQTCLGYAIGESMKKNKPTITKETQKERKERVSSGVKYRSTVFENKKKREKYKYDYNEEIK